MERDDGVLWCWSVGIIIKINGDESHTGLHREIVLYIYLYRLARQHQEIVLYIYLTFLSTSTSHPTGSHVNLSSHRLAR